MGQAVSGGDRSRQRRSVAGSPLPADAVAVPAEHCLGYGQEGEPSRSSEDAADGGKEDAIRLTASVDGRLGLRRREVEGVGEEVRAESDVEFASVDHDLEQQADDA